MMTSAHLFVFYLTCMYFGEMAQAKNLKFSTSVRQDKHFVSAKTGDSVTLPCFYDDVVDARFYWYKLNLGQKPQVISIFYKYDTNPTFHDGFENNTRFTLNTEKGQYHLKITDLCMSDSATYYCASGYLHNLEFAEGATVSVQGSGSKIQALVHQSASQTVQSGDSVTLSCTVRTGTCDGEHSVFWFRNSEESHPGIIYTHGGRNDQCERKTNKQTYTCLYDLPMKNLNMSHAGTYYCAVASCGHILFGSGTKLDMESDAEVDVVAYSWGAVFAFTSILSVLLAFSVCLIKKPNGCKSSESQGCSHPPTADPKSYLRAHNIYQAAVSVNLTNRSGKQRDPTWSECVYFSMKQ
ncbi:uncharacterized protein PAE49_021799 [Odontesthes bonariensis]|uniref:uncharacterized protein LOC142369118 n=1 Tax=Odontesthes bonariensis TaxID=219752 RepID=UPI003F589AD7